MRVKLVAATGEAYTLPEGFIMKDLPRVETGANVVDLAGKDGGVMDITASSLKPKEVDISGRLMNQGLLEAGDLQGARASAVGQYFEIMTFASKARMAGPMRIYREADIVIDPAAEGYDADLEPLGYYLEGWFKGGSSASFFGPAAGGGVVDMTLRFVVPRPLWQGLTLTARASGAIGGGNSVSVSFTNAGTALCRPVFILKPSGAFASAPGKALTLSIDGVLSVSWAGTIGAGKALVFDTATRQVYEAALLPEDDKLPAWDGLTTTNQAGGLVDLDEWASREWSLDQAAHVLEVSSDEVAGATFTIEARHINEYIG